MKKALVQTQGVKARSNKASVAGKVAAATRSAGSSGSAAASGRGGVLNLKVKPKQSTDNSNSGKKITAQDGGNIAGVTMVKKLSAASSSQQQSSNRIEVGKKGQKASVVAAAISTVDLAKSSMLG